MDLSHFGQIGQVALVSAGLRREAPAPLENKTLAPSASQPDDTTSPSKNLSEDSTIRVDVGILDRLMTLVGELVLARNQIPQFNATRKDFSFNTSAQRIAQLNVPVDEFRQPKTNPSAKCLAPCSLPWPCLPAPRA
jgi:chemotaxis protein histidine kinase CheA